MNNRNHEIHTPSISPEAIPSGIENGFVLRGLSTVINNFRQHRLEATERKLSEVNVSQDVMKNTAKHFLVPGMKDASDKTIREIEVGYYSPVDAGDNARSLRPLSRVERRQAYRNGRRLRKNLERGALASRSRAVHGTERPTQNARLTKSERKIKNKAISRQEKDARATQDTMTLINQEANGYSRGQYRLARKAARLERKATKLKRKMSRV